MAKILCILGMMLSSMFALLSDDSNFSWLYIPWALLTLIIAFITYNEERNVDVKKFWIRPSIICLLSINIVGYQLCIDDVLDFSSIEETIFSGATHYADCCFFSAAAFIFAYLLGLRTKANIFMKLRVGYISQKYAAIWLILMIFSFILFVLSIDISFFLSGAAYHGSGAADYNYTISNSFESLYQTLFYITLASYTLLINESKTQSNSFSIYFRGIPILFWICVILYLILRLFSGDRGPVIYNSMAIVYGYIWFSKIKFKFSMVVIAILMGASLVSFWGTFRSRDSDLSIIEKIEDSIDRIGDMDNKSILPFTKELAKSEDTHFMAVRDMSNQRSSYSCGKFTLFSLTRAVPGLKSQYLYNLGFKPGELNSAIYFSISSMGNNYSFGEGTSMFGEAYLEFSIWGMIIFGLLLGVIYKQLDTSLMKCSHISVIGLAIILKLSAQAIYMGRTSFAIELGSILHLIVMYFIINIAVKIVSK